MERLYHAIVAWFTGSYEDLVNDFTSLAARLEQHAARKEKVAQLQATEASKFSKLAEENKAGAAKARATASKIKDIVS